MKKIIYICSPCRGDYEKNIQHAREYCRDIMTRWPDVIPIAPHVYFTQFLDDTKPNERSLGLEAGIALLDMCDELWVYGLDNPSEGMQAEIEYAKKKGIKIRDGHALGEALPEADAELGDVEITLYRNGEPVVLTIDGTAVIEMAKVIRRNRGTSFSLEAGE